MANTTQGTPESVEKVKKAPGPIRTGAVVPTTIFFLICFVFFKFLFDHSIKSAVEWGGTQAVGAEVNVGSVHTSFLGGSFALNGLQVTNKADPSTNVVQIGQIRFAFSWDALLRLKFLIKDAAVDGIALYSPRTSVGWVKPPEPPKPPSAAAAPEGPSTLDKIQSKVSDQVKGSGSQDPLGGISKLLAGTNQAAIGDSVKTALKSETRIKELQAEIKDKQKVWQEKINKMPQKKDFEDIAAQAKNLKFDIKNPKEFADNVKKAKELKDKADVKLKEVKDTTDQLKADADHINAEYKEIDALVNEDIKNVQASLNLSDLNPKELSRALFSNLIAQKLGSYAKYLALAEKYMSGSKKKSKAADADLIPPKRGTGKNYRFAITTAYPLFWLQKATISSKASDAGFTGNISGLLTNVTSDPHVVGQPAILDVKGDFPQPKVMNTHLNVTLDHVNDPVDSITMSIGSYPVAKLSLTDSGDLKLGIQEAVGESTIRGVYKNSSVDFNLNNNFQSVKYDIAASGAIKEALTTVLAGIPKVSVSAHASGSLDKLDLSVESNLGTELSNGLQKLIQGKIDAIKKQIHDEIENKISGPKKQLGEEINKSTGQASSEANAQKQQAEQANKQVTSSAKSSSGANSVQDQIKEKGKQLLKGFKF